jgi:hypothetical protein
MLNGELNLHLYNGTGFTEYPLALSENSGLTNSNRLLIEEHAKLYINSSINNSNIIVYTGNTQTITGIKTFQTDVSINGILTLSGFNLNTLTYIPGDTDEPTGFINRTS